MAPDAIAPAVGAPHVNMMPYVTSTTASRWERCHEAERRPASVEHGLIVLRSAPACGSA